MPDPLIQLFITDTCERRVAMRRALSEQDLAALRLQAHAVKGSALVVGFNELASVCDALERECRTGNAKLASEKLEDFSRQFDTLSAAVSE